MDQAPQATMNAPDPTVNIPPPPASVQTSLPADEPLVCQWQGCQQPHHPSAEALYEHVCETHIGRKSTNNLNLQCFWGSCRTTTVKRDHITSHIRVHVPLKPHKCDFCGKSFKRPQDLKKHVKTHADESVLFNSPQHPTTGHRPPNGYQAPGHDGSYADGQGVHNMSFPYGNGHNPYSGGNGIHASSFGPYPYMPQTSSYDNAGLTESRKRQHDALNEFFGEAKRRHIDAGQYQDLGARFSQFLQMFAGPMGFPSGYNAGGFGLGGGFDNGGGMQYQTQHAPPMGAFSTPFPELKTKNDLMSIDQFLEQLQHTVYDNEGATSGYQPVAGMQHQGFSFPRRSSNSPPRFQGAPQASAATPGSYSNTSFAPSSTLEDTPALTPSSFQTSQSPQQSNQHVASNDRLGGSSLYPTLPSFSHLETNSNAFAAPTSAGLPPSGLGAQYEDYDGRRRYSGGFLQRAQPPSRSDIEKIEVGSRPDSSKAEQAEAESEVKGEGSPTQPEVKLPGVSEITRETEQGERRESEEKPDSKREAWVENVRAIDALREYVRTRLQRGEFERDEESDEGNRTPRQNHEDVEMKDEEDGETQATTPKREGASLYPVLRPVEA